MSDSENCEEEIEIPYDQIIDLQKFDIFEAKLGNLAKIQPKEFNKDYRPEEVVKIKDQKGEEIEKKIPLTNYLRWRYVLAEDEVEEVEEESFYQKKLELKKKNNKKIESNAKIVEWSDGTWQLIIGDEMIDITQSDIKNTRVGVFNKEKEVVTLNKTIDRKFILKANEYENNKIRETVTNGSMHKEAESKIKLAYSYYDKNEYNKDEFGGKYGKPRLEKKKNDTSDIIIPTHFKRKRNRSDSQHDN
jgi:hypothetical protein